EDPAAERTAWLAATGRAGRAGDPESAAPATASAESRPPSRDGITCPSSPLDPLREAHLDRPEHAVRSLLGIQQCAADHLGVRHLAADLGLLRATRRRP